MPVYPAASAEELSALRGVVARNPSVDFRAVALNDPKVLEGLDWGADGPGRAAILPWLKAYQRLVWILPPGEEHRAYALLGDGLHSAIQIAALPRAELVRRWSALFPGEEALGVALHRAAIARRSTLALHLVDEVQQHEPHYRAARFR